MTHFLRLLREDDKGTALLALCSSLRSGNENSRHFAVDPGSFEEVPGAPFAYWVSDRVRETFQRLPAFESGDRVVKQGLATADDFRFVRSWWEVTVDRTTWFPFAKGGAYSPFYADVYLAVNWGDDGAEIRGFEDPHTGRPYSRPQNCEYYFRPGLTWPLRGKRFSAWTVPTGCIFSIAGKMGFAPVAELPCWLGLFNSKPMDRLIRMCAGSDSAVQYEVGLISRMPVPAETSLQAELAFLALRAWSLKRTLDTVNETSHAFLLPAFLRPRLGPYDPPAIEAELAAIQAEIDAIAFGLYGFDAADRAAMTQSDAPSVTEGSAPEDEDTDDAEEDEEAATGDNQSTLLSWCVGVAFGRFDLRLATGQRSLPPEPDPFDPLPAKSPGMLPDDSTPFHANAGILVDDKGNLHDLPKLVEDVLEEVGAQVPVNVRSWLQRDFFPYHLHQYSKSRRKAPLYWPLSTPSGSYTLWVYYPTLTDQTLYTAVNDFLDPKRRHVTTELAMLRGKVTRTREETEELEELQDLSEELTDLREALLKIAPTYHPTQDDGVQITAAPLWPLFRHKPWQKLLKDTWTKLEKGDDDWSHLAMYYWPDRVRTKCQSDKSLAIAHHCEDLYVEPEPGTRKGKGR
jgi:hypothetical protein